MLPVQTKRTDLEIAGVPLLHLFAGLGRRLDAGLLAEHLAARGQHGAVDLARGLPQPRAHEGFGAMQIRPFDGHADHELGLAALVLAELDVLARVRKSRPAVHTQRLVDARNHEEQPDATSGDDVLPGVETVGGRRRGNTTRLFSDLLSATPLP